MTNRITEQNLREMRLNMNETDQEEFDKFVERNWGSKEIKNEEDTEVKTTKRERKTKMQ